MILTRREHFSGLAMQAVIASSGAMTPYRKATARQAVQFADALIEELDLPVVEPGEPDKPTHPSEP